MLSKKFTLRSHKSSITYIYPHPTIPSNVFTADSSGLIINWDLTIRRPKSSWQAHTDTILTISTIENNNSNNNGDGDGDGDGDYYLLTHSRDNTIKIWDLLKFSCLLEIPCNSLNFTIIEIFNDLLFTPSSINSNNLDVYKINPKNWQIKRLIFDFDIYKLVNKNENENGNIIQEIGSDTITNNRNDFGIIMQMKIIKTITTTTTNTTTTTTKENQEENGGDFIIYLGFESGDIVGLQLILPPARILSTTNKSTNTNTNTNDKTIIYNQSAKFILKYHNSFHVPNPIICLLNLNSILISSSITNKLIIHYNPIIEIKNLKYSGIQSIVYFKKFHQLIFGYWNGYIQYDDILIKQNLPKLGTTNNNNINNNIDTDINQEQSKLTKKLTFMTILNESKQEISQTSTTTTTTSGGDKSKYSSLIKSKRNFKLPLLLVGYEDGSIVAYNI